MEKKPESVKKISTQDYGTFEIKSHTTDLGELWSCAGQLAIRGSPAAAADSPAVFTGLSSGAPSFSSGGAPWFSSGAPSLAASAESCGGLSGGVSSDARNSFRFTCGSASPDDQFRKINWMNERTQCCGSGIRCLFDSGSRIRNRLFRIPDPKPIFLRA